MSEQSQEIRGWIESKGISTTCPLCGTEDAWDTATAEYVYPLSRGAVGSIISSNSDLQRIKRAVQGSMRVSRLVKLSCSNCRYVLLLDDVGIAEDSVGE